MAYISVMWAELNARLEKGDVRAIARSISLVENDVEGARAFMMKLPRGNGRILGITGPPGAGKSTLTDALIGEFVAAGKKVAVICVDPSSPFHKGAVLGDRIRMSDWYNHDKVFIRSLATRGAMGGLHTHIIEITDILNAAGYEEIIIETVGVGQSEVDIASMADLTIVVLVPESGDDVQTMKSGLMEVADVFVINKSDRPGADHIFKNLRAFAAELPGDKTAIPVIKTIATKKEGLKELVSALDSLDRHANEDRKAGLKAERVFHLIQKDRMKGISKEKIKADIIAGGNSFNPYTYIAST